MNLPVSKIGQLRHRSTRRNFLQTVATTSMAAATASLVGPSKASAQGTTVTDADILNFALNLEYLEGEYYSKAYYGEGLAARGIIPSSAASTRITYPNTARVTFTNPFVYNYAAEIANDEAAHVAFLRSALGSAAVNEPAINLSTSFDTLASTVGLASSFDPFSNEAYFLLGAFIFEDVGVTAYHGAAGLLSNKDYIPPAAGILSVEGYHASMVRTTLFNLNYGDSTAALAKAVNLISDLRDSLDGSADLDQGITNADGTANIVPTDANGLAFARTTRQVLNIVYGAVNAPNGLFFPNGMNGTIK